MSIRLVLFVVLVATCARARSQTPAITTHETGHGVATCVRHSPDGKLVATTGHDGAVRIWDTTTWEKRELDPPAGQHWSLAFSPDGKHLAAGSDFIVRVWRVKTGKKKWSHRDVKVDGDFGRGQGSVHGLAFTPDSKRLMGGMSGIRDADSIAVRSWELRKLDDDETGPRGHTAADQGAIVEFLAFAPGGDTMATCGYTRAARVWRFVKKGRDRGWKCVAELPDEVKDGRQTGHTMCAAFSPDGKHLIVGDTRGRLQVAGGDEWKLVFAKKAHPSSHVREVCFARDGRHVISAGEDLRIWKADTLDPLLTIALPPAAAGRTIMSMSLAKDERSVVCVDSAGALHVVPLPDQD